MTLRRRLLVAVAALAVLLAALGVAVVVAQRAYAVRRLDAELVALAATPRAVAVASQRVAAAGQTPAALSQVWVGRSSGPVGAGGVVTVLAPAADPALVPRIRPGQTFTTPRTVTTVSGQARRARVVSMTLATPRATVYLAWPTTALDQATRRLALTLGLAAGLVALVLGLIVWWVDRLGLRPIGQMTQVADAIRAGERSRRVPPGEPGSEAGRLGSALNAMIDATEASEARMARFVADVSHELRTPLTTVQGYTDLLATPGHAPDAAQSADAMRRIGAEAARMRRLVDGLLDLTGLEEHGLAAIGDVDVVPLLQDVAADLRVVAPQRRVVVHAPARLVVRGDRDRLTQALVALTANAMRHTPAGTAITLRAAADGGWVRLEVADAGRGIPAEHLPHLFDRFYRVDRGRASGSGGSGLGLAIVASIARAHGGNVAVASGTDGTTFTVRIPVGSIVRR